MFRKLLKKVPKLDNSKEETLELGATYIDVITGFTGIATGLCIYISGCSQALLTTNYCDQKGDALQKWFDVQRCKRTKAATILLDNDETPGCDIPAPVR
jgi:hypothetical protein